MTPERIVGAKRFLSKLEKFHKARERLELLIHQ